MDNQLVLIVIFKYTEAAKVLNADTDFCDTLKIMRQQLPPILSKAVRTIAEWFKDWDHQ